MHVKSRTHYRLFYMKNKYSSVKKYSVIGRVCVGPTCHCIVVFLSYLKKLETGSGYPGNCNRVPGSYNG